MATEMAVFDPGEIQALLDRDLAAGLRALADAIERGDVDGRLIDAQGVGGRANDARAHVMVRLDIAAPVVKWLRVNVGLGLKAGEA